MRQLLRSFISGCLAAQVFVLGLLVTDIGGIGQLIAAADLPLLPVAMLSISLGGLVGAASMATLPGAARQRRKGRPAGVYARAR